MHISTYLKRICFVVLLLLGVVITSAQAQATYGNEWIKHSQTYYKIRVTQTGLHQLDYNYLSQLGLSDVNPKNLQLYRRGKEVAIYVAGEADGKLDTQDYLEFFGERNDGALDKELYKDPRHQINPYYSLYTDTASYFLTVAPTAGKRMRISNPTVEGRTAEPHHVQKAMIYMMDAFYRGTTEGGVQFPWFVKGQGYVGSTSRNEKTYNIDQITNLVTTGAKPLLKYTAYARNDVKHDFSVRVTNAAGTTREIVKHQFFGTGGIYGEAQLEFSDITAQGRTTVRTLPVKEYNADGSEVLTNQISMTLASVTFLQRSIVSSNHMFFYTDSTRSQQPYFSFTGAGANTTAYDVTDPSNIVRTEGVVTGSTKGYVIGAEDGRTHKVLLADATNPIRPVAAQKVNFRNINPAAHNYIILSSKLLMSKVAGAALPAPMEYAAYRASAAGGSYDTLVVFIDDLVNQFHYGEHSANAVRNFLKYMQTSAVPKQMLIIGKGIELDKISYRNAAQRKLDLVPAAGVPAADNFYSVDFRNNSYVTAIPTGRLSAKTAADVINYLNKVKEHEAQPQGQAWQKNILQLGGGTSIAEINLLASYLRNYKRIAEGPYLGANVLERYRQNVSQAVEAINVAKEVNAGVSLLTFFGHSSGQTTDLDIGYASSPINGYNNKGKYPVMLMNGCATGSAFDPSVDAFGEDWIKTPDKGAVAYVAHVDVGYPNALNQYSINFYATAFQDEKFYGKPLGLIHQQAIRRVSAYSQSNIAIATMLEMQFQGDPAVKLYSPDKPDYLVQNNSINILSKDGEPVTASTPEFLLKIGVGNLGKAITDSVSLSIKRTLADNTVITKDDIKIKPIFYADTLYINLSNEGINALGMNTFEVQLDHLDAHAELNEANNTGRYQFYFPSSSILALSPSKYSIVSSDQVKLIAQTTQVGQHDRGFYFEIDTTQAFNSSSKKTFTAANAYLPTWETTLDANQKDSTVYYWRVRFTSYDVGEDTVWANSSFRYIKNSSTGWSQSHSGQFSEATLSGISNTGQNQLKWEFNPIKADIEIRTTGGGNPFKIPAHNLIVDGRPLIHVGCSNPAGSSTPRLIMVVFDNTSLKLVENIVPAYACSAEPFMYDFGDLRTAANRAKIETFLKAVPTGYYVAVISVNNVPFTDFTASQKQAFNSIGSKLIDNLGTGYPFAIVGQKGAAPGSATELSADTDDVTAPNRQDVVLRTRLLANQRSGSITSSEIGPAVSWGTLHHNIEKYLGGNDNYKLELIGINKQGEQQVLPQKVTSKVFDLSAIDASEFPEIRLKAYLSDSVANTAPQLKDWTVLYEAAPEGVIRPDLVEVSEAILSNQANKGKITVPMIFQNITPFAFKDSLEVDVTVTGDGMQPLQKRLKLAPLAGNANASFSFEMPTHALDGNYKLTMYVNPRLQPEQQYFNNIYTVNFKVKSRLHPIMDVAFDGVHILDGELVSPSPLISITVKDENKFVYLQDASNVSVVLIDEEEKQNEIILQKGVEQLEHIEIYPATEKSDFKVEFKPKSLPDGRYKMEIRAKDVAGKQSGISPYRINFEVENRSAITNFYPFPNPFSTKTHFIFTLTGSTIPDQIKIQILTVTGKVVKEIMKEELGPLRIGNNKTEYAWDGTDMYGDKLANGVYLYRVVISRSEEMMYHKQKFGDKAFKNGYGKIYILR